MPSFPAGRLDKRVAFQARQAVDDGHGNVLDGWVDIFSRWAHIKAENGNERMEAGRLENSWRALVKVRRDGETKTLTTEHRLIMATAPWTGQIANIRSIVPTADRAFIDLIVEIGVAS